jgi:hypothetical protein
MTTIPACPPFVPDAAIQTHRPLHQYKMNSGGYFAPNEIIPTISFVVYFKKSFKLLIVGMFATRSLPIEVCTALPPVAAILQIELFL